MTLLDAPKYDAKGARAKRNLSVAIVIVVVIAMISGFGYAIDWPWQLWNAPANHRVNSFLETVEDGDLQKAYGLWNHDPDWQQHLDQYKSYDFNQFQKDWGVGSDYGKIRSHQITVAKRVGNGVVMGLSINGGKTPLFLRVDGKTKTIGFSPVELYTGP
jgi:hypothetical protein